MSETRTGQCLCGAIRFKAVVSPDIQACHCQQCRRWTGGGPLYSVRVSDLQLTGEEHINAYRASEWGERANCKQCGSVLYWKMQGKPPSYVAPGLLDDQTGLSVTEEIFTDCGSPWSVPFDGASQSTEAEEQAKLDAYLATQK